MKKHDATCSVVTVKGWVQILDECYLFCKVQSFVHCSSFEALIRQFSWVIPQFLVQPSPPFRCKILAIKVLSTVYTPASSHNRFSRGSFRHSSPPSCVLRGGRSRLPRPSSSSCFCPSSVLTFRCRASWHRGRKPGTCLFPRPPPAICCSFVCRLLLCGRSFALYARCGRATTQQPHSVTALNSGPLSP